MLWSVDNVIIHHEISQQGINNYCILTVGTQSQKVNCQTTLPLWCWPVEKTLLKISVIAFIKASLKNLNSE